MLDSLRQGGDMLNRVSIAMLFLTFTCLFIIAHSHLFTASFVEAQSLARQTAKDNKELKRLCAEDQSDRTPPQGKAIDWAVVTPRDKARLKRVIELYNQDGLQTANDYDCAATVLLHGDMPEHYLLAHEFWVVAISKGKNDKDTLSLAAASEDRFLMNIGRPQRFGTQLRSEGNGPIQLYPVDPSVTDGLRRVMIGHSLAEVKARVVEMNKK
jgi:hypothetical protein